jgi:tetratricopeptide (TPR) repeat protein
MKRALCVGLFLAGLVAGCASSAHRAGQSATPSEVQRSISCSAYYELEACDDAVAASYGDPRALTLALADRSAAFSKFSKSDHAEADCQEMLALGADLDTALIACGNVALFAGRYEEALLRFDRVKSDASGAGWFGRGIAHFALGNARAAAADFDKAIRIKPRRPDYQLWRYLAWAELGLPDSGELDRHEAAYDWEISSTARPMIDFQLGKTDEDYAWSHLYLFHDSRGLNQTTLRCFFEFNLAHKALVGRDLNVARAHRDAGAAVCTSGELAFHAFKGLSMRLEAPSTEI